MKQSARDPTCWPKCSFNPLFYPGSRTDLKGPPAAVATKQVVARTSSDRVSACIEITKLN